MGIIVTSLTTYYIFVNKKNNNHCTPSFFTIVSIHHHRQASRTIQLSFLRQARIEEYNTTTVASRSTILGGSFSISIFSADGRWLALFRFCNTNSFNYSSKDSDCHQCHELTSCFYPLSPSDLVVIFSYRIWKGL